MENIVLEKTYKIVTFGCQMNARDSEKLAGTLEDLGYKYCEDEISAEIVIFNTCTVRENANMRLYGRIGQLKNACIENKNKIVGICGCMMQETDEVETINKKYPYVKLIFGTVNIDKFKYYIERVINGEKKVIEIIDTKNMTKNDISAIEEERVKNTSIINDVKEYNYKCGINIMFGCDNFCTYCIVPYVRGRERSRSVSEIIKEIKSEVESGVVEVMLLGQNVNSYKGLNDDGSICTFPKLLLEVSKINGLKRIRFMTSHPKDLSNELIDIIRDNGKICKHIHLPVQSGSNRILSLMNRNYTRERYLEIIKYIRENIVDVGITTDIIVGFPGETEEDFLETIDLIKEAKFDSVFTFEYSKRVGTKAYDMENQVPIDIVKNRFSRLLKVVEENVGNNAKQYVGKNVEVLVEKVDKNLGTSENKVEGRMSNNYLVHFNGDKNMIGKFVNVNIVESRGFYFIGEL